MYGDFPAKNTVCTPYIPINVWFWLTLHMTQTYTQRTLLPQVLITLLGCCAIFRTLPPSSVLDGYARSLGARLYTCNAADLSSALAALARLRFLPVRACALTHTHTHTHMHTHVHAHTHAHTLTLVRVEEPQGWLTRDICTMLDTHTHTHARKHTHTYTYIHTCTHMHTHSLWSGSWSLRDG